MRPVVMLFACGERAIDEPLVVSEVEVRLGAVVGDEHFAVLERRHRARIDVEIRVELQHRHAQSALDEQSSERRRGDALAERRDDAAGHEDVFRRMSSLHGIYCSSLRRSAPTVGVPRWTVMIVRTTRDSPARGLPLCRFPDAPARRSAPRRSECRRRAAGAARGARCVRAAYREWCASSRAC